VLTAFEAKEVSAGLWMSARRSKRRSTARELAVNLEAARDAPPAFC